VLSSQEEPTHQLENGRRDRIGQGTAAKNPFGHLKSLSIFRIDQSLEAE
jgi:hypothetical protein